ncbi:MAG: thioesterase, partial [Chlorobi bacterium]|nr:thioesterase [Chlorobiota bacterium]
TGVLALSYIHKRKPKVSMLVFDIHANFSKKATTKIFFTCEDGLKIKNAVEESLKTGEGVTVKVKSTGKNINGDVVSEFYFTWTFKPVSRKS